MSDPNKLLSDVSSSRGAPHGRRDTRSDPETNTRIRLFRVRPVDGDYDAGGAYWGFGRGTKPLYCAKGHDEDGDEFEVFKRAHNREDAKEQLLEEYPNLRFYR